MIKKLSEVYFLEALFSIPVTALVVYAVFKAALGIIPAISMSVVCVGFMIYALRSLKKFPKLNF